METSVSKTQKLADLTGAGAGDTLTIKNTDNVTYTVKVSDIAENYTMHFIYMSKELYSKVFGESAAYNMIVSGHSAADESSLAGHLMDSGKVSNVSFTTDSKNTFSRLVASLNNIILLIIAASSLLALIVLYNLTSINISERKREIATLKVLGFYDNEVNQYIYRETLILTLFSIGIGLILGILLHRPVIRIIEVDSSVFIKTINTGSYIWSFLIMTVFSVTVQIITYFKLKSINMIESLKTVE
jgi:putative ABC transport system permease protein